MFLDFLRARRETRNALIISDPQPLQSSGDVWISAAQLSTIGIFAILLITTLYFGRPIVMPVVAAILIGMTFAPLMKRALRLGISPWLTAIVLVGLMAAAAAIAVTLLASPIASWIARAPEIGENIKEKLYVFDRPLSALRELQHALLPGSDSGVAVQPSQLSMVTPVLAFVTPALTEVVVFVATLIFFLVGQIDMRRYLASFFPSREAKLRFLRIVSDIEQNLASYVAVVTAINFVLGLVVAAGAWAFGFSNPIMLGVIAMLLNYLPYLGPACMVLILLGVGLVTFPTLGYALLPPASFIALTTLEGQIITPTVLGHRLTLNPLAVFLAIAFWAWLWGPMGAFLAVPMLIAAMVVIGHLFPPEDSKLPG
jgi:predicted PurR-regulated permease PerM